MRVGWLFPLALTGCYVSTDIGESWMAPFDGQTGVSPDLGPTLHVSLPTPLDWEIDQDVITVLDLNLREPVIGEVVRDEETITFVPDAPLPLEHDFAWSVQPPEEQPRGPSSVFPSLLVGTGSFSTSDALIPLRAYRKRGLGKLCVLFSRPVSEADLEDVVASLDSVDRRPPWMIQEPIDDLGRGEWAGEACIGEHEAFVGNVARITIDDRVWEWPVTFTDAPTILEELRRWSE